MGRRQLSSTVDADVLDELDRIAERRGESRSQIVNELLREQLNQRRREDTLTAQAQAAAGTASLTLLLLGQHLILWAWLSPA